MKSLILIVAVANIIAFIQMAIDKRLAVKQKNRISEAQLIAPTLFGGFPGVLLGMILFRHKTVKKSFQLKLLLALILFCVVAYFLITRL